MTWIYYRKSQSSVQPPGEKSIEYVNNILDCGDEEAPLDKNEGLVKRNASSLSIKTDLATSTETEPPVEDVNIRHWSQEGIS
jgi:hypothetical protein